MNKQKIWVNVKSSSVFSVDIETRVAGQSDQGQSKTLFSLSTSQKLISLMCNTNSEVFTESIRDVHAQDK